MNEIQRQVQRARRRLLVQRFLLVLPWCLLVPLLVAMVALAIPKFWPLQPPEPVWTISWLAGGVVAGLLGAIGITWWQRCGLLDAAVELDRRFGLRERVSSALALEPDERESAYGQALLADASRRVQALELKDQFAVRSGWQLLLPFAPALLGFALAWLVPDAQPGNEGQATAAVAQREKIKKSAEELQKRLQKRRELAEQLGLKDAEQLIDKLHQGVQDLAQKQDVDRQKALIKLNDLAKEVAQRKASLGSPDQMRKQFERLNNLEQGPAEKVAKALKEGNFQQAINELKSLEKKLSEDQLTPEEKAQLAKQLEQMKQSLEQMVQNQEQAKQELDRQIAEKRAAGDLAGANELQRKRDQLERQAAQMDRLAQMAEKLGQCEQCLNQGDTKNAAAKMAELSQAMQEMQAEMSELESLDELMDELANAKGDMRGEPSDLDSLSMLGGMSDQFSDQPGQGMGEGRGFGDRPEQETPTGEYESRERGNVKKGEAVRVGDAFGPNRAGVSQEQIKEQILSSLRESSAPLTDQRLPKSQREHVNEYFQNLRKGG